MPPRRDLKKSSLRQKLQGDETSKELVCFGYKNYKIIFDCLHEQYTAAKSAASHIFIIKQMAPTACFWVGVTELVMFAWKLIFQEF